MDGQWDTQIAHCFPQRIKFGVGIAAVAVDVARQRPHLCRATIERGSLRHREGRNVNRFQSPRNAITDHLDGFVHITHRDIANTDQTLIVIVAKIRKPAVIGIKACHMQVMVGGAKRPAAKQDRGVNAVSIHIVQTRLGHPATCPRIGRTTVHFEVFAFAATLRADQVQLAARAFEHDVIAIFAMFELRCLIAPFGGQIIGPHVMRRVHMRVGIDNRVYLCGDIHQIDSLGISGSKLRCKNVAIKYQLWRY